MIFQFFEYAYTFRIAGEIIDIHQLFRFLVVSSFNNTANKLFVCVYGDIGETDLNGHFAYEWNGNITGAGKVTLPLYGDQLYRKITCRDHIAAHKGLYRVAVGDFEFRLQYVATSACCIYTVSINLKILYVAVYRAISREGAIIASIAISAYAVFILFIIFK